VRMSAASRRGTLALRRAGAKRTERSPEAWAEHGRRLRLAWESVHAGDDQAGAVLMAGAWWVEIDAGLRRRESN